MPDTVDEGVPVAGSLDDRAGRRVDLGVEIDLDVKEIATIDASRYNGAPCALGNIRYSDQKVGTLLYIKACRRQGFPSDILHYATENPAFPHETTADQFFSESQFESYRRLGLFLTTQALGSAVAEATNAEEAGAAASDVDAAEGTEVPVAGTNASDVDADRIMQTIASGA